MKISSPQNKVFHNILPVCYCSNQ